MRINRPVLDRYLSLLPEIRKILPEMAPPAMDGLLALRGVVDMAAEGGPPEAACRAFDGALLDALDAALDALAAMRVREGELLASVLASQLGDMERLTGEIKALAALQPAAIRERLRSQVAELLAAAPALPEDRLAQEAALLMVKYDVREELDRLDAHAAAAKALLNGGGDGGAVGRKLDFLCQELSREANTLCSKSPDVKMIRLGLDIKAVIDQLREQVQNIE